MVLRSPTAATSFNHAGAEVHVPRSPEDEVVEHIPAVDEDHTQPRRREACREGLGEDALLDRQDLMPPPGVLVALRLPEGGDVEHHRTPARPAGPPLPGPSSSKSSA